MSAYYNEIDPYAAAWLRELIAAGHIAPGEVDARDIREVSPDDLAGYAQCHVFAGIGGWSLALRLAGWPDDRPVWTGSCPCQPLSSAGRRQGHADERHLWPAFFRLVAERRPAVVIGEQVASRLGREWLAGVRADLEHLGYACGAADLPAAGVGAPHIRQRLWWVGQRLDHGASPRTGLAAAPEQEGDRAHNGIPRSASEDGRLADAECPERRPLDQARRDAGIDGLPQRKEGPDWPRGDREAGRLADAGRGGDERRLRSREAPSPPGAPEGEGDQRQRRGPDAGCGGGNGGLGDADQPRCQGPDAFRERGFGAPWAGARLIPCTDGKARRVEPGIQPLAHGVPGRVGRLRAYGNAIVPQLAAAFIRAIA